ncbi:MAG TPA: thioredoxin family protein, partial [Alicycliphilus sp.]|nr:thioredoxin family protein [Alicycliphilus sp.]
AYAAGAATSMAAALLLGGKVFAALKRALGAGEWVRRGLGATMLAGVAAIALGLDTGVLARLSTASTGGLEQKLVNRLGERRNEPALAMQGNPAMMMQVSDRAAPLPDEGAAPSLDGATQWLNSAPLTAAQLRGKVVLVDFWTYSCINCLRTLPYVKAWAEKYRDQGLVVVGVHAPEFAFERKPSNVEKAVKDLGIAYPVALDNQYAIWRAFGNRYWPAHYFIDAKGHIRHHHFGEGDYAESERVIQQLLREAGAPQMAQGLIDVRAQGVQQAADMADVRSPETYLGYERAEHFASMPAAVPDRATAYATPAHLGLNAWGLTGRWTVGPESATLDGASGRIAYRFHARDLHLVLGPGPNGKPVRFKVFIDGQAPGAAHGTDVAADGSGTVTEQRLYQLIRQSGDIAERSFSIEFLDPGVSAYAFTFG